MKGAFESVIGLEVHAQLKTTSKIFCGCSTAFGAPPNSNTCPVCLGLPGALPVLNREAVGMAARTAMALGCKINQASLFARKNYFYPDLPKGYQISQYDLPLGEHGAVTLPVGIRDKAGRVSGYEQKTFRVRRLHLEDDAGKSIHVAGSDTRVDLNRTGVPLVEIVTEADFRSPDEAQDFLSYLRRVLLYLGVCDGNMEEGSLRCDANISVRAQGASGFGTKTEIKNLNSIRFLKRALEFEIQRQIRVVGSGGQVVQETRLWDENAEATFPMRSKEEAHDYRYFPDPDLLPVVLSDEWRRQLKTEIPELPESRRQRFIANYSLDGEAALQLTQTKEFADFFEQAVEVYPKPIAIMNWMVGDLTRELKKEGREISDARLRPAQLASLVRLIDEGRISGKMAKDVFLRVYETGVDPEQIVAQLGIQQISNSDQLQPLIEKLLEEHPDKVAAFRGGKEGLMGFFVGQVMRDTRGQANPQMVNDLLRKALRGGS